MESATLYKLDSKGRVRRWHAETVGNKIVVEHGLHEPGAAIINTVKTIRKGKNIGRANETTPEQQAEMDCRSLINRKKDDGYVDDPKKLKKAPKLPMPMLAKSYKDRKNAIKWPCYVQPKLDGVRCFAYLGDDGEIHLISRKRKEFPQPLKHIRSAFKQFLPKGVFFDGELYGGLMEFQELAGIVRNGKEQIAANMIVFFAFDFFDGTGKTFEIRNQEMIKVYGKFLRGNLALVPTYEVIDEDQMMQHFADFVEDGHEGIMLRNKDGLYKAGHRSSDLQKYKEFDDNEFKIIGAKEGTGKDEGTVIWRCVLDDEKKEFESRPRGTHAQRSEWWANKEQYFGKLLTVRHQGFTEDRIPRFPVGIAIRDYE